MLPLQFHPTKTEQSHKPLNQKLDTVIIHRLGVGSRVADAVRAFGPLGLADLQSFGGRFPYHFFIEADGTVVQVLPLSRQGLHSLEWNTHSVGIACAGDFTRNAPSWPQWRSAQLLCGYLAYPQGWSIYGHTEAHRRGPAATKDAAKECPGPRWDMTTFRDEIRELDIRSVDVNNFWRVVRC